MRVILLDGLYGVGVAGQHYVLHDAVGIDLNVGIVFRRVESGGRGVVGVGRVKPVGPLPSVGYSVVVFVESLRPRGAVERIASLVGHEVEHAGAFCHRAAVGGRAGVGLFGIACVLHVAAERRPGVEAHLLIGRLGAVGGHGAGLYGGVEAHADGGAGTHAIHACLVGECLAPVIIGHALPVVVGPIAVYVVAVDVISRLHAYQFVGRPFAVARAGRRAFGHTVFVRRARPGLVVVVYHVDKAAPGTAVASARAPVVDEAVAEVYALGHHRVVVFVLVVSVPCVACAVEARRAVVEVGQEVVVKRCPLAAPDASVAVGALVVAGVVERLGHRAPLHGEVAVVVERCHLVDAPAERAVVEHYVAVVARPGGVGSVVDVALLPPAESHKPHYDVVAVVFNGVVAQGYALPGGCLTEYCRVAADV